MKVALIGGTGFIGTWLTKALCEDGHEVMVFDPQPFTEEKLAFLPEEGWTYYRHRIETVTGNLHLFDGVEAIVPLVGMLGSVPSSQQPLSSLVSGAQSNLALLSALASAGRKPLIVFPSSDLVYNPQCMYAIHKLLVERYLEFFGRVHEIPHISLRIATGYGPLQSRDSVINFYVRRALAGDSIPVYGEGSDQRAFIYAEDMAGAMALALSGRLPVGWAYNVVGHNSTLTEIAEAVEVIVGGRVEHVEWPEMANLVDVGYLPIRNNLREHGWSPGVSLEMGILKTERWIDGSR